MVLKCLVHNSTLSTPGWSFVMGSFHTPDILHVINVNYAFKEGTQIFIVFSVMTTIFSAWEIVELYDTG